MAEHTRPERLTQNRVVVRFIELSRLNSLGYCYFGNWHRCENNHVIEPDLLTGRTRLV